MSKESEELLRRLEKVKLEIQREVNDRLPRKVGAIAVNLFRQNFRDGGFRDGGLRPWQRTRRQDDPHHPERKYGPLLSRRNHLMNSTQARTRPGEVLIENPVPYAALHNEGGEITTHPTVTPKMRKYAWHMVYSIAGVKKSKKRKKDGMPKELPPEAEKWKALALTQKTRLNVHARIPQRLFIGNSHELKVKVDQAIKESLDKIKKSII